MRSRQAEGKGIRVDLGKNLARPSRLPLECLRPLPLPLVAATDRLSPEIGYERNPRVSWFACLSACLPSCLLDCLPTWLPPLACLVSLNSKSIEGIDRPADFTRIKKKRQEKQPPRTTYVLHTSSRIMSLICLQCTIFFLADRHCACKNEHT